MHPHRPLYDSHTENTPAGQRHVEMRDTLVGPSDRRTSQMQVTGLPQGHMEAKLGYDYANPQRMRPKSPLLSPTSSRDHLQLSSAQPPHDYRSMPSASRFPPEHVRLPQPPSHPEFPYDSYQFTHPDQPDRETYPEQSSPRYPALPRRVSPYDDPPDARYRHHPQQQRSPPYHEYGHPRRSDTIIPPSPSPSLSYPQHSGYAYRHARANDASGAPERHSLPNLRDSNGFVESIPISDEFAKRSSYSSDHVSYPQKSLARDHWHAFDQRRDSTGPSRPSTSTSSNPTVCTSTPTRSAPSCSSSSSRKRKKQFKYMLEHDAPDASKPNSMGTIEEDRDRDRDRDQFDQLEADVEAEGASQRKESRKKVKKACIFCKRSHMPCEEARPCKRCVKRGISHLCRDAEPANASSAATTSTSTTKNKFGEARQQARTRRSKQEDGARSNSQHTGETESESDLESLASSGASSKLHRTGTDFRRPDMNTMPGAAVRDPDIRPSLPVSALLSSTRVELARRSVKRSPSPGVTEQEQKEAWNRSMDPPTQHKMMQMLEAGPTAEDLSDIFGEMPTSLLMTPAMANAPDGQSILRPASAGLPDSLNRRGSEAKDGQHRCKRSLSHPFSREQAQVDEAGFKLPPRPKHLLQEEMATTSELRGGPPTYSYTYGYAKLARWMHTRFSRANCEKVDRSLSMIRPKLMAISHSLPEEELISVEDSFYRLLDFYTQNVLETIPVPMVVARRTGEIYAANSHACKLLQLPASLFEGGQICHYQLVTEQDSVSMWDKYAQEATGRLEAPPSQTAMLEVDRSLLLFNKPGFNPRTRELLGDGVCEDGSEVVVRRKVIVTFEAKISKHGLPFMVTGTIVPIPDDE